MSGTGQGFIRLDQVATAKTLIHNERTKLSAAAVDRASTSFLTAGIAAPVAAKLLYQNLSVSGWYYAEVVAVFAAFVD
jgi:hypothetical protein